VGRVYRMVVASSPEIKPGTEDGIPDEKRRNNESDE
jgi:hypothetical protein